MEILGIGPLELIFIILIALILLGPKDMAKAGRTIGRFLRRIVTSDEWRTMQQASRELSRLPNRLIRDAGLEEAKNIGADVKRTSQDEVLKELKDIQRWQEDVGEDAIPPELLNRPPAPLVPPAQTIAPPDPKPEDPAPVD